MRKYKIIDDSGVDYNFIAGFGYEKKSWLGQIVQGGPNPALYTDAITVEKPFGIGGTYTADKKCFEEI